MKNPTLLAAVILFAIAGTPFPHDTASTLNITVSTDKPHYLLSEDITVYGNLTYNSSPVQDWPVALEIQDPVGTPVVTRTLQTDTNDAYNLTFELPPTAKLGTYTAYVTSSYKGETATNNTTFQLNPLRDVAVTSVTPSKIVVGQGYSLSINVTIENQGEITETFNATAYANTTKIETREINLAGGNSTAVTFTWDTSGFAKGNFTIGALAGTVPDEAETSDNTLDDGLILITIPGDVDADFDVDLYDAVKLLVRYGARKGEPNYDPNCDIDDDDRVFLYDAVILLIHYGQKYP